MKNLFLSLAFMLMASFAFANSSVETNINNLETTIVEDVKEDGSIEFELSCGVEGTISWTGDDVTTADLIDVVMYLDDLLC